MPKALPWRILLTAWLFWGAVAAVAEPLPKAACDAAEAERAALLAGGIQETLRKGPAWGKANLPPQRLQEIARYIALQEDLLFKCGEAKLRSFPLTDSDETGGDEPPLPKRKPVVKRPARNAAADGAGAAQPPKPVAKARTRSKPKVDDAYRPPKPPLQPAAQ